MMLTTALALNVRKLCTRAKTCIFHKTKLCKNNTKARGLMFLERFYVGYYVVAAFSYKKLSTFALRLIHCKNKRKSQALPVAFYSDFNMTHGDLYSVKYISVLK